MVLMDDSAKLTLCTNRFFLVHSVYGICAKSAAQQDWLWAHRARLRLRRVYSSHSFISSHLTRAFSSPSYILTQGRSHFVQA